MKKQKIVIWISLCFGWLMGFISLLFITILKPELSEEAYIVMTMFPILMVCFGYIYSQQVFNNLIINDKLDKLNEKIKK